MRNRANNQNGLQRLCVSGFLEVNQTERCSNRGRVGFCFSRAAVEILLRYHKPYIFPSFSQSQCPTREGFANVSKHCTGWPSAAPINHELWRDLRATRE